MIQAVPPPANVNLPHPGNFPVSPQPLPSGIPGQGTISFYRFAAVATAITLAVVFPGMWFFALLIGVIGWGMAGGAGSSERAAERTKRMAAKDAARQEYEQLVGRAKEAGPEGFHNRRAEFAKLKAELEQLPSLEKEELDKLHSTAQARQKHKFLDGCFIDNADIPGVGPARKAALRSFGIETAADVSKSRVMQVRGFGESLTRAVLDWKSSCERRFVFNPAAAVSPSDRDAVRAKFAVKRIALEKSLAAAPAELHQYRQRTASALSNLTPALETAAKKLAQAEADLSVC
jgi:DNA-binding helix-hairpin-helix protein with protein kinase domain